MSMQTAGCKIKWQWLSPEKLQIRVYERPLMGV